MLSARTIAVMCMLYPYMSFDICNAIYVFYEQINIHGIKGWADTLQAR
jgi:hypothetical protein